MSDSAVRSAASTLRASLLDRSPYVAHDIVYL